MPSRDLLKTFYIPTETVIGSIAKVKSLSHDLPVNRGGVCGGSESGGDRRGSDGGQRPQLGLWLSQRRQRLLEAGEWRLYFLYVSEGQHRAEQSPQFALHNRVSIGESQRKQQNEVHTELQNHESVWRRAKFCSSSKM